jgi:hypothetical protein
LKINEIHIGAKDIEKFACHWSVKKSNLKRQIQKNTFHASLIGILG